MDRLGVFGDGDVAFVRHFCMALAMVALPDGFPQLEGVGGTLRSFGDARYANWENVCSINSTGMGLSDKLNMQIP